VHYIRSNLNGYTPNPVHSFELGSGHSYELTPPLRALIQKGFLITPLNDLNVSVANLLSDPHRG